MEKKKVNKRKVNSCISKLATYKKKSDLLLRQLEMEARLFITWRNLKCEMGIDDVPVIKLCGEIGMSCDADIFFRYVSATGSVTEQEFLILCNKKG